MAPNDNVSTFTDSSKPISVPNCALLLSSAKFVPFLKEPCKRPKFVSPNVVVIGELVRSGVLSVGDKFLRFFNSFASQNSFFRKVISLHQEYQSFCHQIHRQKKNNVVSLKSHNFAAVLPGDSVAGIVVANGILNFLNIYNTLLVVRLVLTWFPNSPPAIVSPLSTICDPYLNIFRGFIPPLGGTLDLSPILAFLCLNAFTSAASALPAELPATEAIQENSASPERFSNLTTSQTKWMRRLNGNRTKSSRGFN